jgi:hypothetical protein
MPNPAHTSIADDDVDKKTSDPTFYIDVKSEPLQEILIKVLRGVKGTCLDGDKPTVYGPI